MQYPPHMRPIRVMCSGAVDSVYILRALLEGADGVFIGGCHPGDCHYVSGNYKARRRMVLFNSVMRSLGLDEERVWLRWISAAEGRKFADTITAMTEHLRKKGPSPFKQKWEV
jgi:F420-non-reducing hydrogenase iron-sulfur subunit